jgi:hypothetical protein
MIALRSIRESDHLYAGKANVFADMLSLFRIPRTWNKTVITIA